MEFGKEGHSTSCTLPLNFEGQFGVGCTTICDHAQDPCRSHQGRLPHACSSRAYWIFAEEEAVRLEPGRQRLGTRGSRSADDGRRRRAVRVPDRGPSRRALPTRYASPASTATVARSTSIMPICAAVRCQRGPLSSQRARRPRPIASARACGWRPSTASMPSLTICATYPLRVKVDWVQGLVLFAPVHRYEVLIRRRKGERAAYRSS